MRLRVAQQRLFSTSQKSLEPNRTHAGCTANDVSFSKPVRVGRLKVFAASASCRTAMLRSPSCRSRTSPALPTMRAWRAALCRILIAELARFPSVGVIAAESTFAVESVGLDDAGLGRRLEVAYLLKGSVRRVGASAAAQRAIRAAATGQHLWAERYDVPEEELFAVQDEIAAKVANALARADRSDRAARLAAPADPKLAAYECWLRGMECLQRGHRRVG